MLPLIIISHLMNLAEMPMSKDTTGCILAYGADFPHVWTLKHLVVIRHAPGVGHFENYFRFKRERYLAQKFSFLGQSKVVK